MIHCFCRFLKLIYLCEAIGLRGNLTEAEYALCKQKGTYSLLQNYLGTLKGMLMPDSYISTLAS